MKIFLDSADIDEIKRLYETGLIDGVTTNPSLVAGSGRDFLELVGEICEIVPGPVSAEVAATEYDIMLKEAQKLAGIADNVAVKLPLTPEGLRVCKNLSDEGIMTNVTLCFSAAQALLAGLAGATFISPFVGRLDDAGADGIGLVRDILDIYEADPDISTQVLVASVRSAKHVADSARLGAHVATIPAKIFEDLYKHPLTDAGLKKFTADWKKTGQSIL